MMNSAKVYYCSEYSFECEKFLDLLPEERLKKYNRLRFEKDKKNCVGAYLLLLRGLKDFGVEEFELEYSSTGKPYIKGTPVYFNLSHSKNGFVCAVDEKEIGVDIQEIVTPKETTINKVCTFGERELVNGSDLNFTRLWTLKESVIKKKGETISQYSKYEFPIIGKDIDAYGNHFVSFDCEDSVITACGEFVEIELIKIKSAEL